MQDVPGEIMHIGEVATFAWTRNDKAQALKPLEEAAEVFGKWQTMKQECDDDCRECDYRCDNHHLLVDECADVIQSTVNLLDSIGINDMALAMDECKARNEERRRIYNGQGK